MSDVSLTGTWLSRKEALLLAQELRGLAASADRPGMMNQLENIAHLIDGH